LTTVCVFTYLTLRFRRRRVARSSNRKKSRSSHAGDAHLPSMEAGSLHDAAWNAVARELGDSAAMPRRTALAEGVASYAGVELMPLGVWMTATATVGELTFAVDYRGRGASFALRLQDKTGAALTPATRLVLSLRARRALAQVGCVALATLPPGDAADASCRGRWDSLTPELLSCIGRFLDPVDLARCVFLSEVWGWMAPFVVPSRLRLAAHHAHGV